MNLPPRASLASLVRHWLQGWLLVAVRTRHPAQFINLCARSGVAIWRVQRQGELTLLHIPVSALRQLRYVRRQIGGRVRIRQRQGLPFLWKRVRRRRSLLLGAAAVGALIWFWSTFIWSVEVAGVEALEPEIVRGVARQAGLYPGVWRWRYDATQVEHALEREFPAIAQALISRNGTKVTITIVEHRLAPEQMPSQATELVASHAGLIERIVVVDGRAQVAHGDVVKAGETLIVGEFVMLPPANLEAETASEPDEPQLFEIQWQPPRGEVWARVWHSEEMVVPLAWEEPVRTGRKFVRRFIRWNGRDILIVGRKDVPFTAYDTVETTSGPFSWRSHGPTVEFLTTTYYETRLVSASRTEAEARQLAESRAVANVLPLLPPGSQLGAVTVVADTTPDEQSVRFQTFVETVQNIAVPASWDGGGS